MSDNNVSKTNHRSSDQSFQTRFEAEIASDLDYLETVLRDGDLNRLIVALPALLNAAMGLTQDTDLSGINAIVTLIQTALLNRPERVIEIAHLALSHFQRVQAVAQQNGDLQSVHPNEALLQIAETPDDLVELSQHLAELEAQSAMPLQVNPSQGTHTLPKFVTDSLVRELEAVLEDDQASGLFTSLAKEPPSLPTSSCRR
jgi:hypothetical protein